MTTINGTAKLLKVFQNRMWIEGDDAGNKHIMRQHMDGQSEPFRACTVYSLDNPAITESVAAHISKQYFDTQRKSASILELNLETKNFETWIEGDIAGNKHVMYQEKGNVGEPLCACSIFYSYGYTDNASINHVSKQIAIEVFGATEAIKTKMRPFKRDKHTMTN